MNDVYNSLPATGTSTAQNNTDCEAIKRVFSTALQPVLVTDNGSAGTYLITYANPAFCSLTGYTLEELVGQSPKLLQGPRSNKLTLQALRKGLEEKGSFTGASFNYKKDGTAYPVQWSISPLLARDGSTVCYVSIQQDLTRLWSLARELKRQKLDFKSYVRLLKEQREQHGGATDQGTNGQSAAPQLPDFMDFDDDLFGWEDDQSTQVSESGDEAEREAITAPEYMLTAPMEKDDIGDVHNLLHRAQNDVLTYMTAMDGAKHRQALAEELTELGRAFGYLVEFEEVSDMIVMIAEHLRERVTKEIPEIALVALRELVEELIQWFEDVFINQSATDIHKSDQSIIASGQQLMMFYR